MADHDVKLNYVPTGKPAPDDFEFKPDKNPIKVKAGQTIGFALGNVPDKSSFRLTFPDRKLFRTTRQNFQTDGIFQAADGDVHVVTAPADKTTYHCELFVDGVKKAESKENGGGDILPDKGN
ncbi:MAG TPA: hypothetical protein VGF59_12765 [Bryobacteraceae bacterium]